MSWPLISEISKDVNSGKTTALENVQKSLKIIKENEEYQAIIATLEASAEKRAKEIDEKVKKGQSAGRLAGVPFIAKDNFLVFGSETTAASNILRGFHAPYQATAIERLEAEGAICVAKANLDAFAHGGSTENSDFFTTKNPVDRSRVPGGSSGGSAASVVLGMAPFALGTDTGGSIRLPASFTGSVGYKPTYGLIPRYGVIAMASSTDVIGPITNSVDDAALVLDVMAGKDILDSTTIDREKSYLCEPMDLKGVKVGVIKEHFGEGVDKGVKKSLDKTISKLKAGGAMVEEVSLPSVIYALAVYYIVVPAEVSSNLSRYDGVKFGYSTKNSRDLEEHYEVTRAEGFGAEAKRRIMIGTYVLSSGYYDAFYKKAALVRTKLINEFNDAFNNFDFLIGPTSPTVAFKIGENKDPLKMYLADIMTVAASLTGIPAVSLPLGISEDLPVGVQVMARQKDDKKLLAFSKTLTGEKK